RGLTNSLDDSIDQMQKTAKTITLYEVREFAPHMRQLGDIAVEAALLTVEAVSLLSDMRKHRGRLNDLTEQVARLASDSDTLYDEGRQALYQAPKGRNGGGDALGVIIGAQIYEHLEKVVDRFEDVANRVNGVLVEHL